MKKLFVLLPMLLLSGCSKLTKANYDQLEVGMSQQEIEAIIGTADSCDKTLGTLNCIWGKKDGKHVSINFVGDKAITFSYDGLQ